MTSPDLTHPHSLIAQSGQTNHHLSLPTADKSDECVHVLSVWQWRRASCNCPCIFFGATSVIFTAVSSSRRASAPSIHCLFAACFARAPCASGRVATEILRAQELRHSRPGRSLGSVRGDCRNRRQSQRPQLVRAMRLATHDGGCPAARESLSRPWAASRARSISV